jgi:hypothetical protein
MCEHLWPVNPKLNATDDFQPYQDTTILWRWLGLHCAFIPFLSVIAALQTLKQGSC